MKLVDSIIEKYGLPMHAEREHFRGFLSPGHAADEKTPLPAGVRDSSRYRLITGFRIAEGMEICCRGELYTVLRVEPVCAFGTLSHYEGSLIKTGGGRCADFD